MISFNVTPDQERRRLQITIAVLCLIPLIAGAIGVIYGVNMTGETVSGIRIDSHVRYLSGLLFGIGTAFLISVPHIERHGPRCRLLAAIVFVGGLARLFGIFTAGWPGFAMLLALFVEIFLVPLLCVWQWRIERLFSAQSPQYSPDPACPE
jgi:hypothetical protein